MYLIPDSDLDSDYFTSPRVQLTLQSALSIATNNTKYCSDLQNRNWNYNIQYSVLPLSLVCPVIFIDGSDPEHCPLFPLVLQLSFLQP